MDSATVRAAVRQMLSRRYGNREVERTEGLTEEYALAYMDDIIIFSRSVKDT